jgi:hypothetical protein
LGKSLHEFLLPDSDDSEGLRLATRSKKQRAWMVGYPSDRSQHAV